MLINNLHPGQVVTSLDENGIIFDVAGNSALLTTGKTLSRCNGDEQLWRATDHILTLYTVTKEAVDMLEQTGLTFTEGLTFNDVILEVNSTHLAIVDNRKLIFVYERSESEVRLVCLDYSNLASLVEEVGIETEGDLNLAVADHDGETIIYNGKPIATVIHRDNQAATIRIYHQ